MHSETSTPSTSTESPPQYPAMALQFTVSLDEEHVFLDLAIGGHRFALGERVHHYPLLLLARRRLEDIARGLDSSSQGWLDIERLSVMLGIERAHLNIQLFRMRRQIDLACKPGRPVVERRRGQIRFCAPAVAIVRGCAIEAGLSLLGGK